LRFACQAPQHLRSHIERLEPQAMAHHDARVSSQVIGQGIQVKRQLPELLRIGCRPGGGPGRVPAARASGWFISNRLEEVIDSLLARMPGWQPLGYIDRPIEPNPCLGAMKPDYLSRYG
jgi:hypothetical protein